MRRKDREITDFNEQLAIIGDCDSLCLALNDPSGFPYIVPLNFGKAIKDGQLYLYFHCAHEGTKIDLIKRDNRASFEMDCDHEFIFYDKRMSCTMGYRSVVGHGTIEIVPDEEKLEGLKILMGQYHAGDFPFNPKTVPVTTVLRLRVEAMTGKKRDNTHPDESVWAPESGPAVK